MRCRNMVDVEVGKDSEESLHEEIDPNNITDQVI